ncbi:Aste57867_11628 [Aphanomyces stellatus]|uniref:Aste57867_11628 protein n=1 Tax=Aphanomyces stellatus TaxID=120398 RepID=A0A485KVD7_9STRA|nr:hypothetical protein As57867_011585 [Aphanomyces stellatus]VFT88486.1 Aste57867_11628 [Aphanomyces stellatus]
MQNTSGILPTSSSSAANPTSAPTNAEPKAVPVPSATVSASPADVSSTSTSSIGRRIAVAAPRCSKSSKRACDEESVVTPLEVSPSVETLVAPMEEMKPVEIVPAQTNKRRCWTCKGKIALSAVTCRCGYTFCNRHRYAEEHNCVFDFRHLAKRKLEMENPRVVPLKVARIN